MQSWMPLIFVVMAVALAVGPIMMMRPTKTQQKLSRLREKALKSGIRVSVSVWPAKFANDSSRLMRYSLPWSVKKPPNENVLLIYRNYQHELHLLGHWDWAEGEGTGAEIFERVMKNSPALVDCKAVGFSSSGVFVDWNERKSADFEELSSLLSELRESLLHAL